MGELRIKPNAADRWVHCPMSVSLEAQYPSPPSQNRREGTAAHWVLVQERGDGAALGQVTPEGEIVTQDMLDGAALWHDHIESVVGDDEAMIVERVTEMAMKIPQVSDRCEGIPDDLMIFETDDGGEEINVFEYKFGYRYVPAGSWAVKCYVAGVEPADIAVVNMHVVQPRNYHKDGKVRTVTTTGAELREDFARLRESAALALGPNPPGKTGEHCRDCSGRFHCELLQQVGHSAMDLAGESLPLDLTPNAAGVELVMLQQAADLLAARITGVEQHIQAVIQSGVVVPGWALESQAGAKRWTKSTAEIIALGQVMGKPLTKPLETITPTQAEKLIPHDVIKLYSERTNGKAKLVRSSETTAAKAFQKGK